MKTTAHPQEIEVKFNEIKKYRHSLYSFLSMMPKGGDLHHHYSGSLYTETYIDFIIKENYFLNIKNLIVLKNIQNVKDDGNSYKRFSDLTSDELNEYRYRLLREWSVRDFNNTISNDEHFFNSFSKFDIASKNYDFKEGLKELKLRALSQKVSYIESMFITCNTRLVKERHAYEMEIFNKKFFDFNKKIRLSTDPISDESYNQFKAIGELVLSKFKSTIDDSAIYHNEIIDDCLKDGINDGSFRMTFQNYVVRNLNPIDVFISLAVSFESSSISKNINGINIVSAENGVNSLLFYNIHMLFYRFFEEKYPNEKYCIHAGELVSGMVRPEHLGVHIKKALSLKNLRRIGHGVDIIYDNDFSKTIAILKSRNEVNQELESNPQLNFDLDFLNKCINEDKNYLVIEINLSSNDFILNVKDDLHPVELYFRNKIPVVICSDDEGILRTSMTEQFALLAYKYGFGYNDIKKLCFDSLRYSHIKDDKIKKTLFQKLIDDFNEFETNIDDFISIYEVESREVKSLENQSDDFDLRREQVSTFQTKFKGVAMNN